MNTLKNKREATSLTQLQFAQKIGIPIRTYQRYESNENSAEYCEPRATTAIKIAKALNTTVEELWNYKKEDTL
ncbi:MAG: helix-turn-helix transcriptional regulator [Selenomonadaceae bacterium]|nr:helix-turn-helix transcriptional regulator [Selenomonadaceae bacterium]